MTAARRILIITNGPMARNPRVFKEATTLGEAGYAVTVLTVSNHPPSEPLEALLLAGARFRRITVNLLPRTGAGAFLRRSLLWVAREAGRIPGLNTIHALGPAQALLAAARREPADLTIVHNEIAHWVGLRLIDDGRVVAADIEDWHSEDLLPADRLRRPLNQLRRMEHMLLHRAVYTTTTSDALASALHTRYAGRRPEVLTNSFPLQPLAPHEKSEAPPAFFWFSQTLGRGRGLEPFVAAWARMQRPSRLVLLGEGSGTFAQELRASVPPARQGHLEFLRLVPAGELPELIARHDIGLALELAAIPNRDLTITNKIIQYLNAGLAIVATDTRGQREVLSHAPTAGMIVALDEQAGLSACLDEFIADRSLLARRQAAARALAATRYCWEGEAPKLLALVATALAPAAGPGAR